MNHTHTDEQPDISEVQNNTSNDWLHPIPLMKPLAPESSYPVDALPSIIQKAVSTYQKYGQQPLPLIACSALANISLACQSLADVARDSCLISPVSLYFLSIGSSGERKSGLDNVFSKATRDWEQDFRDKREPEVQTALTLHHAWQMEKDGLLSQIKRAVFTGEDVEYYKSLLEDLIRYEPDVPLQPTLYFEDATQEALAIHLANGWPSAALWSDEAGIVLGSHGMQSNPTRFVALLNRLWDGKSFTAHRKTTQSFILKDRRLTLNLMMQPLLLQQMTAQANNINRQSGFMARCLMAYPASTMGKRFYQAPPADLNCLDHYRHRITACLTQSEQLDRQGCEKLPILNMSPAAKAKWVQFFNGIETGLNPQGQWSELKDFASKAAENVARLTGLFHLFEGRSGDICAEHMEQSIQIISWHLQEARRLLSPDSTGGNIHDAMKLMSWLSEKGIKKTTARAIQQLGPLRDKDQRNAAIQVLIEHNLVRMTKEGTKAVVELNPYCL